MQLRVTEVFFKEPVPRPSRTYLWHPAVDDGMFTDDMFTAGITVEVDGKRFEAHSTISPEVARTVSLEVIMRPLRRQIMGAIEQQLFGDFNRRDY